jgi:site-specific DNA-cytosine methylase
MLGIDLFAGAGGMALGAAMAGVEIRAAVELHPASCATYRYNHPSVRLIQSDVAQVSNINFGRRDSDVVVFGGPLTANEGVRAAGPVQVLGITRQGSACRGRLICRLVF